MTPEMKAQFRARLSQDTALGVDLVFHDAVKGPAFIFPYPAFGNDLLPGLPVGLAEREQDDVPDFLFDGEEFPEIIEFVPAGKESDIVVNFFFFDGFSFFDVNVKRFVIFLPG